MENIDKYLINAHPFFAFPCQHMPHSGKGKLTLAEINHSFKSLQMFPKPGKKKTDNEGKQEKSTLWFM